VLVAVFCVILSELDNCFSGLFGVISLTIKAHGEEVPVQVEAEEDETVFELKRRCAWTARGIELVMNEGICKPSVTLRYRGKLLRDDKTLKQEGLAGGELLILHFERLPKHILDQLQDSCAGLDSISVLDLPQFENRDKSFTDTTIDT
jgi:hypothetical protein